MEQFDEEPAGVIVPADLATQRRDELLRRLQLGDRVGVLLRSQLRHLHPQLLHLQPGLELGFALRGRRSFRLDETGLLESDDPVLLLASNPTLPLFAVERILTGHLCGAKVRGEFLGCDLGVGSALLGCEAEFMGALLGGGTLV